jgi:cytochrome P450
MKIAIPALIRRFPDLALAEPFDYLLAKLSWSSRGGNLSRVTVCSQPYLSG